MEKFLEKNKNKPFFTNLKKYVNLNRYGKMKVISSFLTNLYIDAENLEAEELYESETLQKELLTILSDMQYFDIDAFINWIGEKL
jgi:hypothetical protein